MLDLLDRLVSAWASVLGAGVLLLAAAVVLRWLYVRYYLSRRLFFEPWVNLSNQKSLNIGESLAELLFFELTEIQKVLKRAESDAGLWNEKPALPAIERAFEGYPQFVRHVELLGLSGRISKLVRFVLLARPQAIRGTIHKYGSSLRLQLVLEGSRDRMGRTAAARCWAATTSSEDPEGLPTAVSELAHNIVLDLGEIQSFKSSSSFRSFTEGLRQHLAYNDVSHARCLEKAREHYERAIEQEGSSAEASCNLADLLYAQFDPDQNEKAIAAYLGALSTDKLDLRARAFRGLANAYCQRRQRHKRGGDEALESALRSAEFASQICDDPGVKIPDKDRASIKKAEAYAWQVLSELGRLDESERSEAFGKAVDCYCRALALNSRFTVVYNNLAYLYLKQAEQLLDLAEGPANAEGAKTVEDALEALRHAESYCDKAIDSDPTFYLAYDNRGNIARAKARVKLTSVVEDGEKLFSEAVKWYHRALSYRPTYEAAYSDLAETHARLFAIRGANVNGVEEPPRWGVSEGREAWRSHWEALKCVKDDKARQANCKAFEKVLQTHGVPAAQALFPELEAELFGQCACVNHRARPASRSA